MAEKSSEPVVTTIERRVKFFGVEDAMPVFADLVAVRHSVDTFSLLFFSAIVPIAEDPKVIEAMEEIPARCISRVVFSLGTMERLYDAMGKNIAKQRELLKRAADDEQAQGMDSV